MVLPPRVLGAPPPGASPGAPGPSSAGPGHGGAPSVCVSGGPGLLANVELRKNLNEALLKRATRHSAPIQNASDRATLAAAPIVAPHHGTHNPLSPRQRSSSTHVTPAGGATSPVSTGSPVGSRPASGQATAIGVPPPLPSRDPLPNHAPPPPLPARDSTFAGSSPCLLSPETGASTSVRRSPFLHQISPLSSAARSSGALPIMVVPPMGNNPHIKSSNSHGPALSQYLPPSTQRISFFCCRSTQWRRRRGPN